MKTLRMTVLLVTALLCSNLQSMESPEEYVLERELVNGDISVEEYLLFSEALELSPRLKELRTAIYKNDNDNLYVNLIASITRHLQDVRQLLNDMTEEDRLKEEESILYGFREIISHFHKLLKKMIFRDDARMPRRA